MTEINPNRDSDMYKKAIEESLKKQGKTWEDLYPSYDELKEKLEKLKKEKK